MTEVVISADKKAQPCEVLSKIIVSFKIFAHSVNYLNNAPYLSYRETHIVSNIMHSVSRREEASEMCTVHSYPP